MTERNVLEAERAELIAKNEATTSWGAAVGARSERIKEIDSALARLDAPRLASQPPSAEASLRGALENVAAISACVAVVENPESHVKMLSNINAVSTKALKEVAEIASVSQSADVVRMREALVAAKCTSRDGTVVHASMDAVIAALDALVPADGMREALIDWLNSEIQIAQSNQRAAFASGADRIGEKYHARHCALLEVKHRIEALAQTEGGKSLTSSDGSGSNAARTCDVPAASPSGDVTQAGHSPLIASDQERNRVRKDAGVAPGPSDPSSTHSEETVGDFAGWCESNGYFASVSFIRALLDQFEIRRK